MLFYSVNLYIDGSDEVFGERVSLSIEQKIKDILLLFENDWLLKVFLGDLEERLKILNHSMM